MFTPRERRFLALAAAAVVCIVSLAFWYAVPPSPAQASSAAIEPLRESFRVDLNTAGVDAMTTLPGLGEMQNRKKYDAFNLSAAFTGRVCEFLQGSMTKMILRIKLQLTMLKSIANAL